MRNQIYTEHLTIRVTPEQKKKVQPDVSGIIRILIDNYNENQTLQRK